MKKIALLIYFVLTSCQLFAQSPTITSFTPTSGGVDVTVTITGTNFTGATAVTIGGQPANSFVVVNVTTITAVTNSNFTTGVITVTNNEVATSATNFTRLICVNTLGIPVITTSIDANGFGGFDLVFTNTGAYTNIIVGYKPVSATAYTRRSFTGNVTTARISQIEGNNVPYDFYIQGQCGSSLVATDRVIGSATSPETGNSCVTPVGNVITPSGTTVTFTWNTVANVHQYQARYQELTSTLEVIGNTGATVTFPAGTTTWTVPQLKPNTNYRFTVRTYCDATNNLVVSPWSDFQYVVTTTGAACLPPLPVTAITGTTNGYASANITWTAPVDVPTGSPKYSLIYRNTANNTHFSVQTDNLNYNLTGLQQGATYEYRVITKCTNTLSSVSSTPQTFIATSGQINNCNFITGLHITPINASTTRLSWDILPSTIQTGRTFSVLYWKLSEPNTIHSVVTDNTTIDLQVGSNNIIADTDYGYRVAVNCDGTLHSYSDDSSFNTIYPPPTITSFTPTSGGVDATVTITGTNFTGATAVTIGGQPANSFVVVNATTITAVTNSNFATGVITVTNAGFATSTSNFTRIGCTNTITNLVATSTTDDAGFAGFNLTWNLGAGTYTAINVFYKPQSGAGSTYFVRRGFAGNATSARLWNVNGNGITYDIYVQGVCNGNTERVSITATTIETGKSCSIISLPATPLTVNNTDITFTWNTVPNAYLYQPIYQECDANGLRVPGGGQFSTAYLTPNAHPDTQSWTVSQLKPNTYYRFAVRVHCLQNNSNLISAYSLYPFIQTGGSGTICLAPSPTLGASSTTNGYASQVINWAAVPSAVNGYVINFRESTHQNWTTYPVGNATSYTISGLKQGSTYIYHVAGACSNGQVPKSPDLTFVAGTGQTYDCNAATTNASTTFSNPVGAGLSWTTTPAGLQVGKNYGVSYIDSSNPTVSYIVYTDSTKVSLFTGIHAGIFANRTYTYKLHTYCDGRFQWLDHTGTFTTTETCGTPTTYTWTGAVSSDWNVAANWQPNGVPTAKDKVILNNATPTHHPTINNSVSIASLETSAGQILGTGSLIIACNINTINNTVIHPNFIAIESTIQKVTILNSEFRGDVNIRGNNIAYNNTKFLGNFVNLYHTGSTDVRLISNTFGGSSTSQTKITNENSTLRYDWTDNILRPASIVNGDLELNNQNTGNIYWAASDNTYSLPGAVLLRSPNAGLIQFGESPYAQTTIGTITFVKNPVIDTPLAAKGTIIFDGCKFTESNPSASSDDFTLNTSSSLYFNNCEFNNGNPSKNYSINLTSPSLTYNNSKFFGNVVNLNHIGKETSYLAFYHNTFGRDISSLITITNTSTRSLIYDYFYQVTGIDRHSSTVNGKFNFDNQSSGEIFWAYESLKPDGSEGKYEFPSDVSIINRSTGKIYFGHYYGQYTLSTTSPIVFKKTPTITVSEDQAGLISLNRCIVEDNINTANWNFKLNRLNLLNSEFRGDVNISGNNVFYSTTKFLGLSNLFTHRGTGDPRHPNYGNAGFISNTFGGSSSSKTIIVNENSELRYDWTHNEPQQPASIVNGDLELNNQGTGTIYWAASNNTYSLPGAVLLRSPNAGLIQFGESPYAQTTIGTITFVKNPVIDTPLAAKGTIIFDGCKFTESNPSASSDDFTLNTSSSLYFNNCEFNNGNPSKNYSINLTSPSLTYNNSKFLGSSVNFTHTYNGVTLDNNTFGRDINSSITITNTGINALTYDGYYPATNIRNASIVKGKINFINQSSGDIFWVGRPLKVDGSEGKYEFPSDVNIINENTGKLYFNHYNYASSTETPITFKKTPTITVSENQAGQINLNRCIIEDNVNTANWNFESNRLNLLNSEFRGDVNIRGDNVYYGTTKFLGLSNLFTHTGGDPRHLVYTSWGFLSNTFGGKSTSKTTIINENSSILYYDYTGNTKQPATVVNGDLLLDNRGTDSYIHWGGYDCVYAFSGNVTLKNSSTRNITFGEYGGTFSFAKDIQVADDLVGGQNIIFSQTPVTFDGGVQSIIPIGTTFDLHIPNIIFKSKSALNLEMNLWVDNTVIFKEGMVYTTSSTAHLIFNSGSSYSGANRGRFVSGRSRKIGNQDFIFPIGKVVGAIKVYTPLGITVPVSNTGYFTAEYFNDPYASLIKEGGLTSVNPCFYWSLVPSMGASPVKVSLQREQFLAQSELYKCTAFTAIFAKHVVAAWDGSKWINQGPTGLPRTQDIVENNPNPLPIFVPSTFLKVESAGAFKPNTFLTFGEGANINCSQAALAVTLGNDIKLPATNIATLTATVSNAIPGIISYKWMKKYGTAFLPIVTTSNTLVIREPGIYTVVATHPYHCYQAIDEIEVFPSTECVIPSNINLQITNDKDPTAQSKTYIKVLTSCGKQIFRIMNDMMKAPSRSVPKYLTREISKHPAENFHQGFSAGISAPFDCGITSSCAQEMSNDYLTNAFLYVAYFYSNGATYGDVIKPETFVPGSDRYDTTDPNNPLNYQSSSHNYMDISWTSEEDNLIDPLNVTEVGCHPYLCAKPYAYSVPNGECKNHKYKLSFDRSLPDFKYFDYETAFVEPSDVNFINNSRSHGMRFATTLSDGSKIWYDKFWNNYDGGTGNTYITWKEPKEISMVSLCATANEEVVLTAPNGYTSYEWFYTGIESANVFARTKSVKVRQEGMYMVKVYDNMGCMGVAYTKVVIKNDITCTPIINTTICTLDKPIISVNKSSEKVELQVFTECAQKVIAGINQILESNRLGINRISAKPAGTPGTANFIDRRAGISTTLFLPSKPFGCATGDNVNASRANFSPILLHRYYEDNFSNGENSVNLLWLKPADVSLAHRRNMNLPFDGNTVPVSYDNYRINFVGVPTTLNIDKINPYIGYKLNVPALTPLESVSPNGLPLLFSDISGTNSIRGTLSLTSPTPDLITWKEVVSVSKVNICEGETLTLTAQGSYESYAWYEGQNLKGSARTLDITLAGIYTLVVTGVGGCPASSYIVVEKNCDKTICNLQDINSLNIKQNNTWILGSKGGINFNTPTPSVFKEGANLSAIEGVSTISDDNGNLLFYTNGLKIWDKTHVETTILLGNSTKSTLIVPNPDKSINNSYYVFGNQGGNLYYSLVGSDGRIINGKQNVLVHANLPTNPTISDKITATYHYNGQDIWLICHSTIPSRRLITYKITPYGISPSSNSFDYTSTLTNSVAGLLKVSPNGNYLVNTVANGIEVFNFSSSGSPSLKFGQGLNNISGVEFSPSSNLLYVSTSNGGLYQYNLAIVPGISRITIVAPSPSISFGAMHLAVDGQIYINRRNNTWLAKIQSPNQISTPQYQANGLSLLPLGSTNFNTTFGLQNQLTSYYPCQLFELSYSKSVNNYVISSNMGAGTTSNGIIYKWYKDGILLSEGLSYAFSSGNSVLTTPNTGIYTVVIEVGCICYNSRDILIKDIPCVDTKPYATDPTVCGTTQTFQLFFDSKFCLFSPHQWDLIAANGTITAPTDPRVLTSFSTLNLGSNCSIELSIQNVPTNYTHLYLQNRNGTCKIPVTINFINRSAAITVTQKLDCSGYVLSASIAGRYSWSAAPTPTIPQGVITDEQNLEVGTDGGTYQVDVINEGCTTRLTIEVPRIVPINRKIVAQYICVEAVPAVPATATTPAIDAIPTHTAVQLTVVNDVTNGVVVAGDACYWSTGANPTSSIIVKDEFEYQVMVTNNNSCPIFLRHEVKFPQLAVTSIPNSDCSKYFITATPGFAPYRWINPAGVEITDNRTNQLELIANSSSYGTYTVTGSLVAGSTCTETVSVTIEPNKIITSVPAGFGNIDNVLSVSASTFSHQWLRTQSTSIDSKSGWGNGGLGTWRTQATFQYIKNRKREGITNGDGTAITSATPLMPFLTPNLKTDGVFSLNMFNWKSNGIAICDSWLKTQHITQYDRLGQEIENKDILNRHTAALYGYKGFLPVATAGNAKVDEIAFESFEEYKAPLSPSVLAPITGYDLPNNNMDLITSIPVISSNLAINYQWLSTNGATFDGTTYVAWIDGIVLQDMTTLSALNTQNIIIKGYSLNPDKTGIFQGKPTSVAIAHRGNRTRLTIIMDASFTIDESPVLSTDKFYWNGEIGIETIEQLVVASTTAQANISTEHKHTGKQSIKFISNLPTGLVFAQFTPKRLNPIIGRKYIVSAWVKLANSTAVLEQPSKSNYDNLNLVGNANVSYRSNDIEGWVRIEQEVLPNATNGDIELKFSKITPDNFDVLYVDDIRIHPADAAIQTYVYDAKNYKLRATLDGNNFASLYFYDEQGNLYLTKKETERGIQTIQESLSHQPKTK